LGDKDIGTEGAIALAASIPEKQKLKQITLERNPNNAGSFKATPMDHGKFI
jgi:hypothetical protein